MRLVSLAVIVASVVVLLAGCENFDSDEIEISFRGDELLVSVCAPISAGRIVMEERADGAGPWSTFFESHEPSEIRAGDVLDIGQRDGFGYQPDSREGNHISVTINDNVGEARTLSAGFVIGPDLRDGDWLRHDGTVAAEPCNG